MILVIDNYDSFTYNLVQFLGEMGADLRVVRNDQMTLDEIQAMQPTHIVISPGPGDPDDGGVSLDVIRSWARPRRCWACAWGISVSGRHMAAWCMRAERLMHGKTSMIYHKGDPMFDGRAQPVRGDALSQPDRRRKHAAGRR